MNDLQGFLAHLREEAINGQRGSLGRPRSYPCGAPPAQQFGIEVDQRQAVEFGGRPDLGNALCQANFGS